MELMNVLTASDNVASQDKAHPAVVRFAIDTVIKLLYPMVPHLCAELWQLTGHRESLDTMAWPTFDLEAAREDELTIVIQISGKVRSRLLVPIGTSEDQLKEMALQDERVSKYIGENQIRKIIVVKDKLINIVV